jgi:hypothetical protein
VGVEGFPVKLCSTSDPLASAGFSPTRTFQVRWPAFSSQDGYFLRPCSSSLVGCDPHAPAFQFFCFMRVWATTVFSGLGRCRS